MTPKEKIEKLAEEVLLHKRHYYSGSPIISDAAYDRLEDELRHLAPEHPVLSLVGTESESAKVPHHPPMLSLAKTYDVEELESWAKDRELVATFKLDGVALSMVFENGVFVQAKTRGNGSMGEDVTSKIRWLSDCPFKIDEKERVEVRGELYCSETQFARLFKEMESLKLEKPSNPRNIVAGVLGRKQFGELTRYFEFSAFEVIGNHDFKSEMDKFTWLKKQGFKIADIRLIKNKTQLLSYLEHGKTMMGESEIGMDGLVFTYNDLSLHKELGNTSHHPRYKMSFKWQGQTVNSVIENFKWLTSRFGIVTPVAVIKPVYLSGAQITNVTLHNASFVKLFNLKIGDEIEIIRSGEVIPKFLKVTKESPGHYSFPKSCPSCNGPLTYDEVRLVCENSLCPAQQLQGILNWIVCAEIEDLSAKRLDDMLEIGLVKHASDLYRLGEEDLLKLPLTKEKMARKLFQNIQKSKTLPLVRFLTGLGINGMGKTSWEALLEVFGTLEHVRKASVEEIMAVNGFAEKTAMQIVEGLKSKTKDIEKLFEVGVHPTPYQKKISASKGPLSGKTFVITGALSRPREEIEKAIQNAGGKTVGAVSSKITAVITDDPESNSSKAKKARDLGIPFWSEQDLEKVLS